MEIHTGMRMTTQILKYENRLKLSEFLSNDQFLRDKSVCELSGCKGICHDPSFGKEFYKIVLFNGLDVKEFDRLKMSKSYYISPHLFDLYTLYNGMNISDIANILGFVDVPGRKPISIDYGNKYEIPQGKPNTSTVFGVVQLSEANSGYLVMNIDGSVNCTSSLNVYDFYRKWTDFEVAIIEQLSKIN